MSRRIRALPFVAGLLVALLACGKPGSEAPGLALAPGAAPLLWRAEAPSPADGTFYLLGSIHMGTGPGVDLGDAVRRAWKGSDELVVEVDVTGVDTEQVVALTQRYGTLTPPEVLGDLLTDPTHLQLAAYLARRGLPEKEVERFKPWFVAFMIVQIELQAAGFDADFGVDRLFMDDASGRIPIVGLETIASQLEIMDRLPDSLQDLMLRDVLARTDHFPEETRDLVEAWQLGDERRLEELVFSPLAEFPELEVFYDLVFYQRNETMAARLVELDGDGKTRFVVLGAGHMIGEQGVPALLAERGYRVTREGG